MTLKTFRVADWGDRYELEEERPDGTPTGKMVNAPYGSVYTGLERTKKGTWKPVVSRDLLDGAEVIRIPRGYILKQFAETEWKKVESWMKQKQMAA